MLTREREAEIRREHAAHLGGALWSWEVIDALLAEIDRLREELGVQADNIGDTE